MRLAIRLGYGIQPTFEKRTFGRIIQIAGQDVVFNKIELPVFRDDYVEPAVIVYDYGTKGRYCFTESGWDFVF